MRRAAPLMGRRPPARHPRPRAHAAPVVLLGRPRDPGLLRADQAARRRPGRRDGRRARRRRAGLNDAAAGLRGRGQGGAGVKLLNRQDERRIANAVIADPEEHTVMDAQRRGALDPGGERRHARRTSCSTLWTAGATSSGSRAPTGSTSRASRSGSSASPTPRTSARSW